MRNNARDAKKKSLSNFRFQVCRKIFTWIRYTAGAKKKTREKSILISIRFS